MPRDSSNNKSRLRHDESEDGGLRMENAVFGSPSWTDLAQDGRGMMTRSSLTQTLIIAAAFIGGEKDWGGGVGGERGGGWEGWGGEEGNYTPQSAGAGGW